MSPLEYVNVEGVDSDNIFRSGSQRERRHDVHRRER